MTTELNNVDSLIAKAPDDAKKAYMERIWKMTKDQIFHELMRVHGKSSELLTQAQSEINRLNILLNPEDGDSVH